MTAIRKVIWSEGILLGQQHFQAWDRYHEQALIERFRITHPRSWGLHRLRLDPDAPAMGICRILELEVILPDGRLVTVDPFDDAPLACELPDAAREPVVVYLLLTRERRALGMTGYEAAGHRRGAWQVDYVELADEHDTQRQQEVALGRLNLILGTETPADPDLIRLPVTRLTPRRGGGFQIDDDFVPPLLSIEASPALQRFTGQLAERIRLQSRELAGECTVCKPADRHLVHAMSGCLQRFLIRLEHLRAMESSHPEGLHLALAETCAEIQSLVPQDDEDRTLPLYRHEDPASGLQMLQAHLWELLDRFRALHTRPPVLEPLSEGRFQARDLTRSLSSSQLLYITVRTEREDTDWIRDFPRQAKVASADQLDLLIRTALPGVSLCHLPRPPADLPVPRGRECFRLEPQGESWQALLESNSLGIFLPAGLRHLQLELMVGDREAT
ncbi:type VI secretion system baseplate subunit TssK [Ectothiorhodospira variabilis]|uniref:type VI secretion system baseplate subunit TssK n=1 Tax=Ectothiorhodospira variabilis TaxID=505694 RepID=UPI001EFABC28|nr:type VI secretion system baseplate subunit TssK [Ectothiorhodospira variabilis]MCG5494995.1 type VI secretion system baseplate subunit TssK [Ectothiorhodospira variabilis]MCG5504508.1 type VI secretion system baseplate subunit TssK [Ectothiorhodospira variabilis]MCG5507626.1 type VI secretion system baseplate subunit TssK [Ectothiorhodospira variabilis]